MALPAKVRDYDYIQFLLAAQTAFSCVEAACTSAGEWDESPAHDAYTRLLVRQPSDTEALWQETQPFVQLHNGLLVLDDSTLDKPHAKHMALVHKHGSGKHHRSVLGINLATLLWTDGGVERCQARTERAQRNHILLALRAFVRLEQHRLQTGRSWYASKKAVVRKAICAYRANLLFTLSTTA